MTQDQINEKLRLHRLWLDGKEGGVWANFTGVDCSEADFTGACLHRADFTGAYLAGAGFRGADCSEADFTGACLHRADFRGADCRDAVLRDAVLRGAGCRAADFTGACLRGAGFRGADCSEADFTGADFTRADFTWADFTWADFTGAIGIKCVGPVGAHGRLIYAVDHLTHVKFQAGCFWDTADELRRAIREHYSDGSGREHLRVIYLMAVDWCVVALEAERKTVTTD